MPGLLLTILIQYSSQPYFPWERSTSAHFRGNEGESKRSSNHGQTTTVSQWQGWGLNPGLSQKDTKKLGWAYWVVPSSCQVDFLSEPSRRELEAGLTSHPAIKTNAIWEWASRSPPGIRIAPRNSQAQISSWVFFWMLQQNIKKKKFSWKSVFQSGEWNLATSTGQAAQLLPLHQSFPAASRSLSSFLRGGTSSWAGKHRQTGQQLALGHSFPFWGSAQGWGEKSWHTSKSLCPRRSEQKPTE